MASHTVTEEPQRLKGTLHVSAASLGTNASGIATSTTSYAGSELSGISQFPAPPTEIPTPTLSNFGTPTSDSFGGRLPASIPDYGNPTRFRFGILPSPRSPSAAYSPNNFATQDTRSVTSGCSTGSGVINVTSTMQEHTRSQLHACNDYPGERQLPSSRPPVPSEPPTSYQPVRPLVYWKRHLPYPSVTEHPSDECPGTPHSLAGSSSLFDWSNATCAISVNPSEERLLTTSFIASLLSQTTDPFPGQRLYGAASRDTRGLEERENDGWHQPRDGATNDATSSHHSIPPFYPSDLLSVDQREAHSSREIPSEDRRSILSHSRRVSKDCSDMLHSDEQLQFVIRRPSIAVSRGGIEARPVRVMPAFQISSNEPKRDGTSTSFMASNSPFVTAMSVTSRPPVHRADAPQNVLRTASCDGDGIPRESDEGSVRQGSEDLLQERPKIVDPSTPPVAATSSHWFVHMPPKSGSSLHQASGSGYSLGRNHSMKSVVSSLVSRISHNSVVRRAKYMAWLGQRPLPPLPLGTNRPPEFPNGKEIQHSEESISLPALAKRAEELSGVLNGRSLCARERDKHNEFYYKEAFVSNPVLLPGDSDAYVKIDKLVKQPSQQASLFSRFRKRIGEHSAPSSSDSPTAAKLSSFEAKRKRRRLWTVVACVIIGVVLAIALPVGLSQQKRSMPACKGNQTGVSCTLDGTCICTGTSGACKPLAHSLALLVSDVNTLFTANFTDDEMSDAVVSAAGVSADGLCTKQALLIDVEPGLDSASAPNRTKWAQAAMLWNLGLSEDIAAAAALQRFVSNAPWDSLSSIDGPVDDSSGIFVRNVSGFSFDFAAQSISTPSASFQNSFPSEDQLEEVSDRSEKVLDRMYAFAIASSTQRENALLNYWTAVLQRQESELEAFKDALRSSPFLIPFDATSSPGGTELTSLMKNTSSTQYPVPISCYPGLDTSQLERINTFETTVFGLDPVSPTSHFSQDCFIDRPVYGVVDLLRLRLPFPDDRRRVALQASALSNDAKIRAIIYSGEVLSALPGSMTLSDISSATTNPREFGSIDFLDHVLLNYFSSISNTTLAMDVVSHVLLRSIPVSNSSLANSLSSLPVLEFAVFGSIRPQDIAFSVSSFSTPTSAIFFGSDASETFRSWALVNTSASIAWTESAFSSEVVYEGSSTNQKFESVWQPASELVASGSTDVGDVQRVVSSLRSLGLFSP